MKTDQFYLAVRKTDGKEWFDINAWGYVVAMVDDKTSKVDKATPHWSKDNPVVRVAQVEIKEINTETQYTRYANS